MDCNWIDTPEALRDFCGSVQGDVLAVDTESDHFHAYQAQVCLIQVATPRDAALIDPLALQEAHLEPLFDLLEDASVTKILHAARNDIIEIDRDWAVGINNLFDTRTAARFLGYRRNSLDWLLDEIVGVSSPGKFQRFDWTTRPLPDKARRYALADVLHLFDLREVFLEELETTGWRRAFEQRCANVARTSEHEPKPFDPEGWRDIKQGRDLDGRGRAALRELYLWRHELCEDLNRAALHVFPNHVMAKVARRQPTTLDQLGEIKGMPRKTLEHNGQAILEIVERARTKDAPPARRSRRNSSRRRSRDEKEIYNALRRWRNDIAEDLQIPSEFIATNAVIRDIAADPPETLDDLRAFPTILEWHVDQFGDEILAILSTLPT